MHSIYIHISYIISGYNLVFRYEMLFGNFMSASKQRISTDSVAEKYIVNGTVK